jgi:hypothetical protein
MSEPYTEAKIRQTGSGDFILEIDSPYDVETYIQAHDRQQVFRYVRPCKADRVAGYSIEQVICSSSMSCEVHDRYAWQRMQHEEAMEVLRG